MLTNGFSGWTLCLKVWILFMSAVVDKGERFIIRVPPIDGVEKICVWGDKCLCRNDLNNCDIRSGLMLLTIGIMGISGYTSCVLGLVSRVFEYTLLAPSFEDSTSMLNLNKTRKNAIVENLDYQIPVTQLSRDMQVAKRD